jgi:cytochrome oxidase Cu insertion factor (SCO1/SenC/PrrC family)
MTDERRATKAGHIVPRAGRRLAGLLVVFAVGIAGGTLASRSLLAPRGATVPKLSEVAVPPGRLAADAAARPPIGLSPVPVPEARPTAAADRGHASPGPTKIPWADPYPAPAFTLTDHEGRAVSLRDLAGRVVLVNFIYTNCQTTCPLETQELRALQQALGPLMGTDVVFLSVTIDPKRDTPAVLKQYGVRHGVDFRSWRFLTGSDATVRQVLEAYRVPVRVETLPGTAPGSYELGHGNPVYLIDQWTRVRKRTAPTMLVQIGRPAIEWLVKAGRGDAEPSEAPRPPARPGAG